MASQHVVQFYDDEDALVKSVSHYIAQGLDEGQSVVIVTDRRRQDALFAQLDQPLGDLVVLDSERTLDALYSGDRLSASRFDAVVGKALREAVARSRSHGVRAYGDMVDRLWQRGRLDDALELERYWNDLQVQLPFDLYCAYNVDLFVDFDPDAIASMLCTHTSVVSNGRSCELHSALDYAMYETLGQDLPRLTSAENTILWLREHLPEHADEILTRARNYASG